MTGSKILPMEDMLTVGGWMLYVGLACIFIGTIAFFGHLLFDLWKLTLRAIPAFWGTRKLDRLLPSLAILKLLAVPRLLVSFLALVIGVSGMSLGFADLIWHQKVQAVSFDQDSCELIYRVSRFNARIPYHAIDRLKWETLPTLDVWSGQPTKHIGDVHLVIETRARTYVLVVPGHGSELQNAQAVYAELKSRLAASDPATDQHRSPRD